MVKHDVKDLALATEGKKRIEWADNDMPVLQKVREKFEEEAFQKQKEIEEKALALYKKNPKKARKFLTQYSNDWMNKLTKAYWKLGDDLWSKYTGKF